MARSVKQGEAAVFKLKHCLLGENCNPPRPFKRVVIKKAVSVVNTAQFFYFSGKVEHGFRQCGLTCVHMCQNTGYQIFVSIIHSEFIVTALIKNINAYCYVIFMQNLYIFLKLSLPILFMVCYN